MQKKLEAELMSIAHSILQMKNRDDIKALKEKAYETYEKLAVLSYIEDFVKETPQNNKTVEELVEQTFSKSKNDIVKEVSDEKLVEEEPVVELEVEQKNDAIEESLKEESVVDEVEEPTKVVNVEVVDENLEVVEEEEKSIDTDNKIEDTEEKEVKEASSLDLFTKIKDDQPEEPTELQSSLKKEFGETVSIDVATNMFENATRVSAKKSLNDVVMQQKNLQIDLNDRISFVKHLFNNSQEDFNRVVSQLNTMTSEKEALSFLKMVKKEYNWGGKEIYEDRLILLIERKFN